jgi:hypothetical protein
VRFPRVNRPAVAGQSLPLAALRTANDRSTSARDRPCRGCWPRLDRQQLGGCWAVAGRSLGTRWAIAGQSPTTAGPTIEDARHAARCPPGLGPPPSATLRQASVDKHGRDERQLTSGCQSCTQAAASVDGSGRAAPSSQWVGPRWSATARPTAAATCQLAEGQRCRTGPFLALAGWAIARQWSNCRSASAQRVLTCCPAVAQPSSNHRATTVRQPIVSGRRANDARGSSSRVPPAVARLLLAERLVGPLRTAVGAATVRDWRLGHGRTIVERWMNGAGRTMADGGAPNPRRTTVEQFSTTVDPTMLKRSWLNYSSATVMDLARHRKGLARDPSPGPLLSSPTT